MYINRKVTKLAHLVVNIIKFKCKLNAINMPTKRIPKLIKTKQL